jgi:hypothetical protein
MELAFFIEPHFRSNASGRFFGPFDIRKIAFEDHLDDAGLRLH